MLISFALIGVKNWFEKGRVKFKKDETEMIMLQWCLTHIVLGTVPECAGVPLRSLNHRPKGVVKAKDCLKCPFYMWHLWHMFCLIPVGWDGSHDPVVWNKSAVQRCFWLIRYVGDQEADYVLKNLSIFWRSLIGIKPRIARFIINCLL